MTHPQQPLARVRGANPVPEPVEPDWSRIVEHVERGLRTESQRAGTLARRRRRTRRSLLGGLALCAALIVTALIALAPGSGSSDFLARAAAALTPGAGTILYERWEHVIEVEPGNRARPYGAAIGPEQLWIEGDAPRRYRAVLEPAGDPVHAGFASDYGVNVGYSGNSRDFVDHVAHRLAGRPLELGGTLQEPAAMPHLILPTLSFLPPHELVSADLSVALGASLPGPHDQIVEDGTDPVSALRAAIAEGRAHAAGTMRLHGRTVQRIDFDLPQQRPAGAPPLPAGAPVVHPHAYAYVEGGSFHPVEIVLGLDTYRFLAYRYLPATAGNRLLTSIRAQHPDARIVDELPPRPKGRKAPASTLSGEGP